MAKVRQIVRMKRRNWDADFFASMLTNNAFVISEPAEVTIDGTRRRSLYGPQSPLYGTTYDDEQAFIERTRCECGAFCGAKFQGEICPICGTKVEARDSDVNTLGWILLGDNRIINPYYYNLLCSAIGTNEFPDMIMDRHKITKNGRKVKPTDDDYDGPPLSPYSGKGIDYFHDNFLEVMDYFKSKRKHKADRIDRLIKEKRNIFCSHIPIMSTMLRPQSSTQDSFYYNTMDKMVNTIFTLSELLKDCAEVERDYLIGRIQLKVNGIWNECFSILNGKEGWIRGNILGGLKRTLYKVICIR